MTPLFNPTAALPAFAALQRLLIKVVTPSASSTWLPVALQQYRDSKSINPVPALN